MLNKLQAFVGRYQMLQPGDRVVCAVSGGADSIALLFAMYLLRQKLQIEVSAAHFNHQLRGEESDRDEAFVRFFCNSYDIPLYVGSGTVVPYKKGLEAAARDARYAYLRSLPGKIATAHTADDNAETLLMHLIRGTGLKGLGGIAPLSGALIRPMLSVTRQEVLAFLREYNLSYVTDSSNETDRFLRNRLRHHVMPILAKENPQIAKNLSALALHLRQDEETLSQLAQTEALPDVPALRQMPAALRSRAISSFLERCGVSEPESSHIALVENVVFSEKPSAKADLPGGVTVVRRYDKLEKGIKCLPFKPVEINCSGEFSIAELELQVICEPAGTQKNTRDCFTVLPKGNMVLRPRQSGDSMRLPGGTKELKKIYIDRKIPASLRPRIPVLADEAGVLGVYGIGVNLDRCGDAPEAVTVRFEPL